MRAFALAAAIYAFVQHGVSATPVEHVAHEKRAGISQSLYDDFVRYFQYSASAYHTTCASPSNNTLVGYFTNAGTDTQGFVARDDKRKEIVVAFGGTSSKQDFITDFNFEVQPFTTPGVFLIPSGVLVHQGFMGAYNSVSSNVVSLVKGVISQRQYSGYTIISTGHSLGGALAAIGGVSLKGNFFGKTVKVYTYGQPRTGNSAWASYVDNLFGQNFYRSTHYDDSVPTFVPRSLQFEHSAVEYWSTTDTSSPAVIKQCSGNEDPSCSDSIPSTAFINQGHLVYYNIFFYASFC